MTKSIVTHIPDPEHSRQTSFLDGILDPRVRRLYNENGLYIAIADLFEFHGNQKNPNRSWAKTLAWMTKAQGFKRSDTDMVLIPAPRGKPTTFVHEDLFWRILQSADVPEWEPLRQWGAALMKQEVTAAPKQFFPRQSPMYRRAIDSGLSAEDAERAANLREALREQNKKTNEVRQRHGAVGTDYGRLNAVDSQVATGKTPQEWKMEHGIEGKESPQDYQSLLDNAVLLHVKRRATKLHVENQSQGETAMEQDIRSLQTNADETREDMAAIFNAAGMIVPPQASQPKLLKEGK